MTRAEKIAAAKKRVRKDDYPATGMGPWRKFRDEAHAVGEFRLDKIGENWAKKKASDARRAREKQQEQDNRDHHIGQTAQASG